MGIYIYINPIMENVTLDPGACGRREMQNLHIHKHHREKRPRTKILKPKIRPN